MSLAAPSWTLCLRARSYTRWPTSTPSRANADALVEQAITDGADVVFTTSPKLVGASLRAAVRHPQVHILNCSTGDALRQHPHLLHPRVRQAKFITGAIAGAMAGGDRIGYVADYPSFGVPANINAFALGARMTNPNVRIDLQWTCLPDQIDPLHVFTQKGITVISGRDVPMPNCRSGSSGTFPAAPGRRAAGPGHAVLALGPVL